ncbi:MAG: hypothetical protein AAFS02_09985 [Pseudomonadota bacterium]
MKTQHLAVAVLVSLTAACGGGSGGAPAVNGAPTISNIADQSIDANVASTPISFSVSDEIPSSVTVVANADRPEIVSEDGLLVRNERGSGSLLVTPQPDVTGETTVSVVATDDLGQVARVDFLLSVVPEQRSLQQFARDTFTSTEVEAPTLINAVEFAQDADEDDFADLLAE